MSSTRFSAEGSAALEARIAADLRRVTGEVLAALPAPLVHSIVLTGGFGRGEGGVLRTPDGEVPYNDYDFFVVLRDVPSPVLSLARERLGRLAARLTGEMGVEVELAALRRCDLARMPQTLMATDMRLTHRVLWGDPDAFACMPEMPPERLLPIEASRLLLNRAALLLLARPILAARTPDAQAIEKAGRYVRKSALARGDTWLMLNHRYEPEVRRRLERVTAEAPPDLAADYVRAARERLGGGEEPPLGALRERLASEALALLASFGAAESARLSSGFPPWSSYPDAVLAAGGRCDARMVLREVRAFGPSAALLPGTPWARCAATLPAVLAGADIGRSVAALLPARHDASLVDRWLALWPVSW